MRKVNPKQFIEVLSELIAKNEQLRKSMALHKESEYKSTFLSDNNLTGFGVTNDGEIVNVFNIDKDNRGAAGKLIKLAITQGGNWLNAFDGFLVDLYKRFGFVEYKREKNWTEGEPDVVYMRLASKDEFYAGYKSVNPTNTVNEVKMSPSVFSKGLVSSEGKGVLIGFEFEVCVPVKNHSELSITSSQWEKLNTLKKLLAWIEQTSDSAFTDEVQWEISESYVDWTKKITKDLLELLSDEGLDNLTSLYDEVYDKHSLLNMTKFVTTASPQTLQRVLSDFLELSDYEETDDYQLLYDHYDRATKIKNFVNETYGNITGLFKKYNLKYAPQDKESDDKYHLVKNEVRDAVQSEVAATKVHVIDIAKTIPKNLTDWYIEPDTTIVPDDKHNYTGAEIVSPPLPTKQAMQAFRDFYACSQNNGWLTNGSTGLHINLSIPQKIDVLKLSLFLGDKYVLKSFGRDSSDMAKSVLDNLEKGVSLDNIVGLNSQNMKRLQQSADYFADDHYASISFETNPDTMRKNKYISFRHAGGDYLNEMGKIIDTIGRFVTAMQIAADPSAHRTEYLKKLHKLTNGEK